jgi:hypothetical protein
MNTMRHIILSLTLFLAFPQQTKAEFDNRYIPIAIIVAYGIYGVAHGIQGLVHEQKRKNDLVQNYIIEENKKYNMSSISNTSCVGKNDLELINCANNTGLEIISNLYKNDFLIQQAKQNGILVQKEISFEFLTRHNLTQEDLDLLVALKRRNYQDIPAKIIDEIVKKRLSLEEKLSVQPT